MTVSALYAGQHTFTQKHLSQPWTCTLLSMSWVVQGKDGRKLVCDDPVSQLLLVVNGARITPTSQT